MFLLSPAMTSRASRVFQALSVAIPSLSRRQLGLLPAGSGQALRLVCWRGMPGRGEQARRSTLTASVFQEAGGRQGLCGWDVSGRARDPLGRGCVALTAWRVNPDGDRLVLASGSRLPTGVRRTRPCLSRSGMSQIVSRRFSRSYSSFSCTHWELLGTRIAKAVERQKAWVNELVRGLPKGGRADGAQAQSEKAKGRSRRR